MSETRAECSAYQVPVTSADIEAGVRRDPRSCAVAVAIRRQLGLEAVVTGAAVEIAGHPTCTSSLRLADWLWDFDEERGVEPIVVELRPADGIAFIGGYEDGWPHPSRYQHPDRRAAFEKVLTKHARNWRGRVPKDSS